MEDLSEATESLKNLVARPGTFEIFYPETTDDMLAAVLMDGFAETQLEGLMADYAMDDDGFVTPEISRGQAALVALYAAVRFLRAELINRNTNEVYKAGSASYEYTQATNILRDILKGLLSQKDRVTAAIGAGGPGAAGAAFFMADQYLARQWEITDPIAIGW
jgi:hypothetical protein